MAKGKFHVNTDTGRVGKCSADLGGCPYDRADGEREHFTTREEARDNREAIMARFHAGKELQGATRGEAYDPVRTPPAIDTELAKKYEEGIRLERREEVTVGRVRHLIGDHGRRLRGGAVRYQFTISEAMDLAQARLGEMRKELAEWEALDDPQGRTEAVRSAWDHRDGIKSLERTMEDWGKLQKERGVLRAEFARLERVFQKHRWSRFFMAQSTNGHIHSSMDCSTCNKMGKPTRFGWLPQLSGKDEAAAVADQGALLCTTCYPSAPTEWTNQHELDEAKKQAESCPGSGTTNYQEGTKRMGYYSGNGGRCAVCGEWVSCKSRDNPQMRKHRPRA